MKWFNFFKEEFFVEKLQSSKHREVLKITLMSGKQYIVKINLNKQLNRLKKEIEFYNILKKNNIPTPKIYKYTNDFIIMEYLGDNILRKNLNNEDFFNVGEMMKKIHSINYTDQYKFCNNNFKKFNLKEELIKKTKEYLNKLNLNKNIINIVKNIKILKNKNSLCHMDLSPNQVMINSEYYIIDWEWGLIADPIYDITKTEIMFSLWGGLFNDFINGYEIDYEDYDNRKRPFIIFHLVHYMNLFKNEKNLKKYNECEKLLIKYL